MSQNCTPSTRKREARRPRTTSLECSGVGCSVKTTVSWLLFGAVAAATMSVRAQGPVRPAPPPRPAGRPWTAARTASGAPDIQGVWNYGTMTPLERPAQWTGKEVLTQEEAAAYEKQTVDRRDE